MLTDSMHVACTLPRPSPRSQLNRSFENGGTGPQDTTALTEPKKGIKPTPCMEKLNRTGSQLESATKELKDAKAEIETLTDRITRLMQEGKGSQTVNAALTTTLECTKTELDTCKANLEQNIHRQTSTSLEAATAKIALLEAENANLVRCVAAQDTDVSAIGVIFTDDTKVCASACPHIPGPRLPTLILAQSIPCILDHRTPPDTFGAVVELEDALSVPS